MILPDLPETEIEYGNDDLNTPAWVVDLVRQVCPVIHLDPCSNPRSVVGAQQSIIKHHGQDGLARPWSYYRTEARAEFNIYCNPPYSAPKPWSARAVEAYKDGCTVVLLVKADFTTKWAHTLHSVDHTYTDLDYRITFGGGAHKTGMLASRVYYLGPNPQAFTEVFRPYGNTASYPGRVVGSKPTS